MKPTAGHSGRLLDVDDDATKIAAKMQQKIDNTATKPPALLTMTQER